MIGGREEEVEEDRYEGSGALPRLHSAQRKEDGEEEEENDNDGQEPPRQPRRRRLGFGIFPAVHDDDEAAKDQILHP
ncbi:hypothetical protein ACLOJK_028631 [Asimina triloba]